VGLDIYLKDLMSETAKNLKDALSAVRRSRGMAGARMRGRKHRTDPVVSRTSTAVLNGKCPICCDLIQSERRDVEAMLRLMIQHGEEAASIAGRKMCIQHLLSFIEKAAADRAPASVILQILDGALDSADALEKTLVSRIDKYSWDRRDSPLTADEARVAADAVKKLAGSGGLRP
jgi:hypothetical protein